MIQLSLNNCKWGMDATDFGVQLGLQDPESNIVVFVPFDRDALSEVIIGAAKFGGFSEEQLARLAPYFTGEASDEPE